MYMVGLGLDIENGPSSNSDTVHIPMTMSYRSKCTKEVSIAVMFCMEEGVRKS